MILSILVVKKYSFSFFFWMDLVGVLYISLDIYLFMSLLDSEKEEHIHLPHSAVSFTDVAQVGKTSKAGTKAGRLIKLIRIIRIMRVAKLYR